MAPRSRSAAPSREPPRSTRRGVWLRAAILAVAAIVAYANSLSGPFVLDDAETIVANEQIRQLSPSVVLFPARELPVAGRPVVNVSFALNYALGGLNVRGYHVVNVAIHLLCALLLFGIVRRTLDASSRTVLAAAAADIGFATALLWLVHPLQTDAVDYVTQRTELMMGLFYLLALYASVRGQNRGGWLGVAVASCALGMGSKESMVTAPLLIAVYDRTFVYASWKEAWRKRWPFYAALGVCWLVLVVLMWSGPRSRSAGFATNVTPWRYLLNQTVMIVRYLRLAFWPHGFALTYGVPAALTLGDVWPYAAFVVLLAALTVVAMVRWPRLGFLGIWFFVTLAPTSSLVPIATEVGAERRMYLPLAALVVLAVVGALLLWERLAPSLGRPSSPRLREGGLAGQVKGGLAAGVALTILAGVLAGATVVRNREYESAVSLARLTMERWPTPRAEHWLGIELLAAGQHDAGLAAVRHALADDPTANYTLGLAYFQDGRLDEALPHLQTFVAREPLLIEVPTAREMIGRIHDAQGRHDEAVREFRLVLSMTPSNRGLHGLVADALFKQQKFDEAVVAYRQFLQARPGDLRAEMNLGVALIATGHDEEAAAAFRRAVAIDPRDQAARRNLARVLVARGEFAEAEGHARQAVGLRPDDPVAHDELGVALAGQRKLDEAVAELQRARQLDPQDEEIRQHLAQALHARGGLGSR
ncbi:MAG: tetratricopeptide repeat protein [Acidobacteriota bacterium]